MPIYKGNTKIVKLYKGTTQIVKRYKGTDLIYSASRLPSTFQEVEYLESTGTQYIDSGLLSTNDNYEFTAKIKHTNIVNATYMFGSTNGFNVSVQNNVYRATGQVITNITPSTTSFDKIVLKSLTTTNTIELEINNISQQATYTNWVYGAIVVVFGVGTSQTQVASLSNIQLSELKIKINGTLTRNFVPCYRKVDNVAGLYDLVNGVFYTNAGTGTFIVGGNV